MTRQIREIEPQPLRFSDDGSVPNNTRLPMLVYAGAVILDGAKDPAVVFERLFAANEWGSSWRNGIYPFVHYHSQIHEVLGIARGNARVRFGGGHGVEIALAPGDVAVLPAGTGHHCLHASPDLLVIGAYPPEGTYDLCRGTPAEHRVARALILKVPVPSRDPLYGADGPLVRLWER